jgi:enoyl-CoA hydratase/carnithine racemase
MELSQELLSVERKGQIFILTLRNGEDNKLSLALCNEILAALDYIQEQLGLESEGALIIQGNNAKFFTNVSSTAPRHCSLSRLLLEGHRALLML